MATTTIDTETELSAVNSILGAIGQSAISSIEAGTANPEVAFVYNLLRDANVDIQNEGWHFNTERHVAYQPNDATIDGLAVKAIQITNDILKLDISDGWTKREYDVVKRNGYLYDKYDHTYDWSDLPSTGIDLDVVKLYQFTDLPSAFRRYIIYRASRMAATQLVTNPQLVQLLGQQEALARASCMEYECNQGNHSMMGFPEDSVFTTYQPWRALSR